MGTKLVDLYCNCSNLMCAHHLFDELPKRNLFLWNVLIRGYAWDGPYEVAIKLFYEMVGWGKDVFVGAALIDMYAKCGCVGNAREVFDEGGGGRWCEAYGGYVGDCDLGFSGYCRSSSGEGDSWV
ncbi:hypothetical protein Droror1_Dr00001703 [Drosera rotundifolia]